MQKLILRSNGWYNSTIKRKAWCHWCRLQVPIWKLEQTWLSGLDIVIGAGGHDENKKKFLASSKTQHDFSHRPFVCCVSRLFVLLKLRKNIPHSPTLGICISTCSLILFCAFFAVPSKHRWGYSQTSLYKDIDETYFSGVAAGWMLSNLPMVSQNPSKTSTWNAKCPIFLGNFTPKTSNYCLKNGALGFPGIEFRMHSGAFPPWWQNYGRVARWFDLLKLISNTVWSLLRSL